VEVTGDGVGAYTVEVAGEGVAAYDVAVCVVVKVWLIVVVVVLQKISLAHVQTMSPFSRNLPSQVLTKPESLLLETVLLRKLSKSPGKGSRHKRLMSPATA
jgi:hypothetical protein